MLQKKLPKRLKVIILIIIIIGFIIYDIIKYMPSFLEEFGLSNIKAYKDYNTMVEFNLSSGPDFAFLIDKNNKIIKGLYLNKDATSLSLDKIENKDIKRAIYIIFEKLYDNKDLNSDTISMIKYDDKKVVSEIKNYIEFYLYKKEIESKIEISNKNLKTRAKQLDINTSNKKQIIIELSLYSNYILKKKEKESIKSFDQKEALNYSNQIYKKLEDYKNNNHIENLDVNSTSIKINLVPTKEEVFADADSWYYINNGKVYAYIKFTKEENSFSFCYNGSINNYIEGECKNEKTTQ